MTPYLVYDVFTDRAFGGNPLAVVMEAQALDERLFPAIAREFNFSETTFVLPPTRPDCDARVRIFTPTTELPFAGHPIIGTALALRDIGHVGARMTLEIGVGPIAVETEGRRATFETRVGLQTDEAPPVAALAACAGLATVDIRTDRHAPVFASLGTSYVLIELASDAALGRARPVADAFLAAAGGDVERLAIYLYRREGDKLRARMFHPLGGTPEDPATGSAAAALAAFLGQQDGTSQRFTIHQGTELGRPSVIGAKVDVEGGRPVAVRISGEAVGVMQGQLTL